MWEWNCLSTDQYTGCKQALGILSAWSLLIFWCHWISDGQPWAVMEHGGADILLAVAALARDTLSQGNNHPFWQSSPSHPVLLSSPSLMLHLNKHLWAHMHQRGSYSLMPVGLFSVFLSSGQPFSPGQHCKAVILSSWSTPTYAKYGRIVLASQLKLFETAFPVSEDI